MHDVAAYAARTSTARAAASTRVGDQLRYVTEDPRRERVLMAVRRDDNPCIAFGVTDV
jgi:hypothetical protein